MKRDFLAFQAIECETFCMKKFGEFILWGTGVFTERLLPHLGIDNVIAFIDSNPQKIGTEYLDRPVISFAEYKKSFSDKFIVVTPLDHVAILAQLQHDGIATYFCIADSPAEFTHPVSNDVLKNRMLKEYGECRNPRIFGSEFYSLLLNQWFFEESSSYCPIILPEMRSSSFRENLQKQFPKMQFVEEKDFQKDEKIDRIFVTDEWEIGRLSEKEYFKRRVVNAFDISDREESYYNPEVEKFRGIHQGESCFVIGLGPSLKMEDIMTLKESGLSTFSVNLITRCFKETGWKPDFYVITDSNAFKDEEMQGTEEASSQYSFLSDASKDFWKKNQSSKNIRLHVRFNVPDKEEEIFSEDVSRLCADGGTCIYICLQLAAYMGFQNIYLLGIDLADTQGGKKNAVKYSHFYDPNPDAGYLWVDMILKGYRAARKYADSHGIHIYNATRGGYLEVFDRVDMDSLFTGGKFTPEKAVIHRRPVENSVK